MQVMVRMGPPVAPAGDIVNVENPLYGKRDVSVSLQERQIATIIRNFRKLNQIAILDTHLETPVKKVLTGKCRPVLPEVETTIEMDRLSGEVRCFFRTEIADGMADLLDSP